MPKLEIHEVRPSQQANLSILFASLCLPKRLFTTTDFATSIECATEVNGCCFVRRQSGEGSVFPVPTGFLVALAGRGKSETRDRFMLLTVTGNHHVSSNKTSRVGPNRTPARHYATKAWSIKQEREEAER